MPVVTSKALLNSPPEAGTESDDFDSRYVQPSACETGIDVPAIERISVRAGLVFGGTEKVTTPEPEPAEGDVTVIAGIARGTMPG